jgi:hypothetical protein
VTKRTLTEIADQFQYWLKNRSEKWGAPARLQELADSLTAQDLLKCGQKWLATFTPFFTDKERKQAGCQHRLFFSQVEYCDFVPGNKIAIVCPPRICGGGSGRDVFPRDPEDVTTGGGHISSNLFRRTITERQERKEVVHVRALFCPPGNT